MNKNIIKPRKLKMLCRNCSKLWTNLCPVRVWGRVEKNKGLHLDVNPNRDFCSRFKQRAKKNLWLTIVLSFLLCGSASANDTAIKTIMLEAQGESLAGQTAVGEVIRNRALKDSRSVDSVCMAPYQFSCWNSRLEALKRLKKASPEAWQRASKAWAESEGSNLTHGSEFYIAKKSLKYMPAWVSKMKQTTVIGNHTFYKERA